MKLINNIYILLLLPALSGCLEIRKESEFDELESRTRSYDITASQLTDDTTNSQLSSYLQSLKREEGLLNETLANLKNKNMIDEDQAGKLKDTHNNLRSLRTKKMRAILNAYDEYIVDFYELNRWKLPTEEQAKLAALDWSTHCADSRKVIIYGYGDPIGGDLPTMQISEGRAGSVADWILRNSNCQEEQLLVRGLGIDIKTGEIRDASLLPGEKESLYRKSRYARILLPKIGQ